MRQNVVITEHEREIKINIYPDSTGHFFTLGKSVIISGILNQLRPNNGAEIGLCSNILELLLELSAPSFGHY